MGCEVDGVSVSIEGQLMRESSGMKCEWGVRWDGCNHKEEDCVWINWNK